MFLIKCFLISHKNLKLWNCWNSQVDSLHKYQNELFLVVKILFYFHNFCLASSYFNSINLILFVVQSFKSYPTPCDPMDWSMPGFPVLFYLPEFAQTHVHWVSDTIWLSHPLLPASPPALSFPQDQGLFQWVSLLIRWPKYWSFSFNISPFNEYSGLIFFRIDRFDLFAVQVTQESSPAQFKSISSLALSLLYGPTLMFLHDYWKNHSFGHMDLCQQSDACFLNAI